jgi:hypothetical protein
MVSSVCTVHAFDYIKRIILCENQIIIFGFVFLFLRHFFKGFRFAIVTEEKCHSTLELLGAFYSIVFTVALDRNYLQAPVEPLENLGEVFYLRRVWFM